MGTTDFVHDDDVPMTSRRAKAAEVKSWFWELVREFDADTRCALLQFVTGSSRLPLGGFKELDPKFSVDVSQGNSSEHLPHAHTCANKLVLHEYTSKQQLCEKLKIAVLSEGFGFM